jgi:hypothetical protein
LLCHDLATMHDIVATLAFMKYLNLGSRCSSSAAS